MNLKINDYVCIKRRYGNGTRLLEFGVYLGPLACPVIAFTRAGFDQYWPMRFPRSPLYLIRIERSEPVIIRQISYKGCPIEENNSLEKS